MKKDMRRETTANNSTHISTGSTWMTNEYNANVRKTDTGYLKPGCLVCGCRDL